jgi:hypothetical protein
MKNRLSIGAAILICALIGFWFCRPSSPVIYYQPPSVKQPDLAAIEELVRARGERHFKWIVFSTLNSNEVQVAVGGGVFHPNRRGNYWLRRAGDNWQIYRVDDEDFPVKSL